jgi:hypothetical protein
MKPCRGTPRQPQNRDDHSTMALSAGTTAHAFSRRWAAVANSASWLATMAASNNSAKIARSPEASSGGSAIGGSIGGIHAYLLSPGAMKAKTPQANSIQAVSFARNLIFPAAFIAAGR